MSPISTANGPSSEEMTMSTPEEIKSAIQRYYSDTSRSRQETRDGLEEVAADVEMLIDTLRDDTD